MKIRRPPRFETLESRQMLTQGLFFDLNTTPMDSYGIENPVELSGSVYFLADDANSGIELWKSDGTTQGTSIVRDIGPGEIGIGRSNDTPELVATNERVFFVADDGVYGRELWTSDGTFEGTRLVKDIHSENGHEPQYLTVVGELVYFCAYDENRNPQLWISDGTEAGTRRLGELAGGTRRIVEHNGRLIFIANERIYSADGSQIEEILPEWGFFAVSLYSRQNELFIKASLNSNRSLWQYTGEASSPVNLVRASVSDITIRGDELYYTTGGNDIVRVVDGQATSLRVVEMGRGIDLVTLDDSVFLGDASGVVWRLNDTPVAMATQHPRSITDAVAFNGSFYFVDCALGCALWQSDTTDEGSRVVTQLSSSPDVFLESDLVVVGDELYFEGNDGTGKELWKSDGTAAGTVRLTSKQERTANANVANMTMFQGMLYFTANDGASTRLWKMSGPDFQPMPLSDEVGDQPTIAANSNAFFVVSELGLWAIENDVLEQVYRFDDDPRRRISVAGLANDQLFFWTSQRTFDSYVLWSTAGTPESTGPLMPAGSQGYFAGTPDGTSFFARGTTLWTTDGTVAGTNEVTQFANTIDALEAVGVKAIIGEGQNVWATDGTAAGTVTLVDDVFRPFLRGAYREFAVIDALVVFNGQSPNGNSLWRTDLTPEGTIRIEQPVADWDPIGLVATDNRLLFSARNDNGAFRLWEYDPDSGEVEQVTGGEPISVERMGEGAFVLLPVVQQLETVVSSHQEILSAYGLYFDFLFYDAASEPNPSLVWQQVIADPGLNYVNQFFYLDNRLVFETGEADDEIRMLPRVGDSDFDGDIGFADFLVLTSNFGTRTTGGIIDGDHDGDDMVTFKDFLILSAVFGT